MVGREFVIKGWFVYCICLLFFFPACVSLCCLRSSALYYFFPLVSLIVCFFCSYCKENYLSSSPLSNSLYPHAHTLMCSLSLNLWLGDQCLPQVGWLWVILLHSVGGLKGRAEAYWVKLHVHLNVPRIVLGFESHKMGIRLDGFSYREITDLTGGQRCAVLRCFSCNMPAWWVPLWLIDLIEFWLALGILLLFLFFQGIPAWFKHVWLKNLQLCIV